MGKPTVNLWLLNYQSELVRYDRILPRLAPAQSQRASTLRGKKRKLEFGLGRLLLDHAIRHEPSYDQHPFAIRESQGFAPIVSRDKADSETSLSISHSGSWIAVIAWTTQEKVFLGVDVESLRLDWNDAKASYFCNDQQLAYSNTLLNSEQQRYLTRLWTQKEAFFKARQAAVLNADTRSIDFTDNTLMHSACLNTDYQLSVYCSLPVHINTKFVALDSVANITSAATSEDARHLLVWS